MPTIETNFRKVIAAATRNLDGVRRGWNKLIKEGSQITQAAWQELLAHAPFPTDELRAMSYNAARTLIHAVRVPPLKFTGVVRKRNRSRRR
jgi:predicted Rossmann fold nucleotide-binding protein DprA/Smf involved in DNA uptake